MAKFNVRDSESTSFNSFFPGQTVLDSDGVAYFVPVLVLDSDGNEHAVLLASTKEAVKSRKGTIENVSTQGRFI